MSMPKLNAPAEIHWRRSNMNTRDPILMKYVEVLKDCRSLNEADEMNCPMPRSVEKVPIRNEKRCTFNDPVSTPYGKANSSLRPDSFLKSLVILKIFALAALVQKFVRMG